MGKEIPADGSEYNEISGLLDKLVESGWDFAGGDLVVEGQPTRTGIAMVRQEGRISPTPEFFARYISLRDESGRLPDAIKLSIDEETGRLAVECDGLDDDSYRTFLQDVISGSNILNAAQSLWEIRERLGPERAAEILDDLRTMADPAVQEALAQAEGSEDLVDITPDEPAKS